MPPPMSSPLRSSPTSGPGRRISGPFDALRGARSSSSASSSVYRLVRPAYTLALLVAAAWISVLTRYAPGPTSPVSVHMPPSLPASASANGPAASVSRGGVAKGHSVRGAVRSNGAGTDGASRSSAPAESDDPFDREYDNCIVGAGLSGSVIAENYARRLGQTSLIIEKRPHVGGNCYDYVDADTGIRVSQYGAHLFHTRHERVWDYVRKFSEWVPYEHKVLGMVNGKHVPIPVNIDTVNALFDLNIKTTEEMDEWLKKEQVALKDKDGNPREALNSEEVALTRVGSRLYEWIFKPYTHKQWAKYPAELGPEVLARIPVRNNRDGRYFSDPHQALPKEGYTAIFDKILSSPKITVLTDTDYFEVKDRLKCKRLYYTGPIDAYFAHLGWPKLEYRSLSFERVVQHDTPGHYQPASVVNHPQTKDPDGKVVDYTRIVEYKHMLNQTSDSTVYFVERSTDDGEPYYPVPNKKNKDLFQKYKEMAEKEEGVTFVGRLANYKYFNMDDAISNALELFDEDTEGMTKE
ncbi:hypothetical protein ACHAWF_017073 [Thalassiosira exigua]